MLPIIYIHTTYCWVQRIINGIFLVYDFFLTWKVCVQGTLGARPNTKLEVLSPYYAFTNKQSFLLPVGIRAAETSCSCIPKFLWAPSVPEAEKRPRSISIQLRNVSNYTTPLHPFYCLTRFIWSVGKYCYKTGRDEQNAIYLNAVPKVLLHTFNILLQSTDLNNNRVGLKIKTCYK